MQINPISFQKGYIRIPSQNKVVNTENINIVGENKKDKSSYILMNDCIEVNDINAPVSSITSACIEAQVKGTMVDVKEKE